MWKNIFWKQKELNLNYQILFLQLHSLTEEMICKIYWNLLIMKNKLNKLLNKYFVELYEYKNC